MDELPRVMSSPLQHSSTCVSSLTSQHPITLSLLHLCYMLRSLCLFLCSGCSLCLECPRAVLGPAAPLRAGLGVTPAESAPSSPGSTWPWAYHTVTRTGPGSPLQFQYPAQGPAQSGHQGTWVELSQCPEPPLPSGTGSWTLLGCTPAAPMRGTRLCTTPLRSTSTTWYVSRSWGWEPGGSFPHSPRDPSSLPLQHSLCCDNCHSHVALALNLMRYNNSTSWNMVTVCFFLLLYGKYVR